MSGARRSRTIFVALALVLVLASCFVGGCGGSSAKLEISAAASLKQAFTRYGAQFKTATTSFSFAGSDALAAQIEQGARPDVFASANTKLPDELHSMGLVERPVLFAANKLVLAVPDASKITGLAGVERPGVSVVLGTASVPVGGYSEKVIARLAPAQRFALLANVRDREPDVTGIVGKLVEGAADAGFLYATDVKAAAGKLRAIELPSSLQPRVDYAVAVVLGSSHSNAARAFIAGLLAGSGRGDLLDAGFLAPPGG